MNMKTARTLLLPFAFCAGSLVMSATFSLAQAQTISTLPTANLNLQALQGKSLEVKVSPNLLTTLTFNDDIIDEISTGNGDIYSLEMNSAMNEVKLRAVAKAGYTNIRIKLTSGLVLECFLRVIPDSMATIRDFTFSSPIMPSNMVVPTNTVTAPAPYQPRTTISPALNPTVTPLSPTTPTNLKPVIPVKPTFQRGSDNQNNTTTPINTRTQNPSNTASNQPLDYRTQTTLDDNGNLNVYYTFTNRALKDMAINPNSLKVKADGKEIEYRLARQNGTNLSMLEWNKEEQGIIQVPNATKYGLIEVSWNVTDGAAVYAYSRSLNAKDLQTN